MGIVEIVGKETSPYVLMGGSKMEVNSAILKSSLNGFEPDLLEESAVSIPKKNHATINQITFGRKHSADTDCSTAGRSSVILVNNQTPEITFY